jgi:hypothetical protein
MQNLERMLKDSIAQMLKEALESISNSHGDSSCHIEKETKELSSSSRQNLGQIPSLKSTLFAQPPKLSNTSCTTCATPTSIRSRIPQHSPHKRRCSFQPLSTATRLTITHHSRSSNKHQHHKRMSFSTKNVLLAFFI